MQIEAVRLIYFSPTHTTRRVLAAIARGMRGLPAEHVDLTLPAAEAAPCALPDGTLAVLGAPVYGGRIPPPATRRLQGLRGRGVPAVVVVVYGNRAYEDALLELRDLAVEAGFVPIAGAAFIGEHSFSTEETPLAHGRPDAHDEERAAAFGEAIRTRLDGLTTLDALPLLEVPGDAPYKALGKGGWTSPRTRTELCTLCGTCAAVCPTAAIAVEDTVATAVASCILCCACVKHCPTGARVLEDPRLARTMAWLSEHCAARREPELYL